MFVRIACAAVIGLAATPLRAGTIIDEDFRAAPGPGWVLAGTTRLLEGTGAVLVEKEELGSGALAFDRLLASEHLSVRAALSFERGDHGMGDGAAIALVAAPAPAALGDGGGLLGIGNLPGCDGALIIELDLFPNTPDDFGPMGAALAHAGIAYARTGAVTGDEHLPTFAAAELPLLSGDPLSAALDVRIDIHDGRVIVCAGPNGAAPARILEAAIPNYAPFSGYLTFCASNGGVPGRVAVVSVAVETESLPPPALQGHVASDGAAELAWTAEPGLYEGFVLYRDGAELAALDAAARDFRDAAAPGRHIYELVAAGAEGRTAPPTGVTLHTGMPFLVVDRVTPGAEPSVHAHAWLYALEILGRDAVRVNSVTGLALDRYAAVLWINGSGATQGTMPAEEQEALARYVTGAEGARLYIEGAELWALPGSHALGAVDGIAPRDEAWPCTGVVDSSGAARAYFGEAMSLATLAPAPEELGGTTTALWRRAALAAPGEPGDAVAIVTRTPADRAVVIGTSMELCRLGDGHDGALAEYLAFLSLPYDPPRFLRGDSGGDGRVDIADAIHILAHLFSGKPLPACPDAADANDDGTLQISDPITVLAYLFLSGPLPAPGARACGADPTPDTLSDCIAPRCP